MATTDTLSKEQTLIPSCRSESIVAPITSAAEPDGHFVSPDEIRMAAYLKWEAAGRPESDGVQFWSEAEQELQAAK